MNNFQLYRTNLQLGGQMKWDIIVNSAASKLYVSDFHLSPISNNIPYTYKSDENLLNYNHQDNVKTFYKTIEGYFYNEGLNSEFAHNWPLICKENDVLNSYSNIYDMGCRRSKNYKLYKKQFEFFCPVWIEHLYDDIKFKINIKPVDIDIILASNSLVISKNEITEHNKFVNYFNDYVNACGLINGCDDLINVRFSDNTCMISGLNTSDGTFVTISNDSFVNNITMRERPLMEVDNMLVNLFSDNSLICKQLFNFNLCFNFEDIVSGSITKLLSGQKFKVEVEVYIGNDVLEQRDFYTNYEFIEREVKSNSKTNISKNVFEYLNDNNYLDFVTKNKFCQSICHWSLSDNNDYIFNLYNGFSGISVVTSKDAGDETYKETLYENLHQYGCTPNTMLTHYDESQNTAGWLNTITTTRWNDFYKYIKSTENNKTDGIYINGNNYINNIKYNNVPIIDDGFYVLGLITSNAFLASIIDAYPDAINLYNNDVYCLKKNDLLLIISDNGDLLTFKSMSDILYNIDNSAYANIDLSVAKYLNAIYLMMSSKVNPELIMFGGSLLYGPADGPSKNIDEITYYKDNDTQDYVFRYDGKLKPTFVNDPKLNILYYKDYVSDDRTRGKSKLQNSDYIRYINSEYEPLYSSINYCAIKGIKNWNYEELPTIVVSEHTDKVDLYNDIEYPWFNSSVIIPLNTVMHFKVINKKHEDNSYESLDSILYKCIKNAYNIDNESVINYILSKYSIINNWDYFSDTNIDDYIYDIVLTLK